MREGGFEGECWWLCNLDCAGILGMSRVSVNHLSSLALSDGWVSERGHFKVGVGG